MAFDPQAFKVELAKSVIDAATEHYKENTRVNAAIDDKAQKVAGIAGVFLAAALAFIKIDNLSVWPFNRLRVMILLALTVTSIIFSIAFCLIVLWVRAFPGLPTLTSLQELQSDLFAVPEENLHLYEKSYWHDRATIWKKILHEQDSTIDAKSRWLFRAQGTLALAMFTIALLLMVIVGPMILQRWGAMR